MLETIDIQGKEVTVKIEFRCKFSITESGCLKREDAMRDAPEEWQRIKNTINNVLDYVSILEISEPVVTP